LFSAVLMSLALISVSLTSLSQSDEAKMAMPQPVQISLPDDAPDVSAIIAQSASRSTEFGACYIPHDPATWTQPTFENLGGGGDDQDDGSSDELVLPFVFDLYGDTYSSLFININGNISFTDPYWQFSSTGFPSDDFIMIAPFWGDVDLGGVGEVWYLVTPTAVYINWVGVGYFNEQTNLTNTFQLIITDGTDPLIGVGNNVAFFYDDMAWTTGSASGGSGGFGGTPATVGINAGNGVDFIQIGRFDHSGDDYDGPGGNNDGVDWLDNQCLQFDASDENVPPIAEGFPTGNEMTVCVGETVDITVTFLAPEIGQTASTVVSTASTGLNVTTNTDGNPSMIIFSFTGSNANLGANTITFVSTDDDAENPLSTTINLIINVSNTGECSSCNCPNSTTGGDVDDEAPVLIMPDPLFVNTTCDVVSLEEINAYLNGEMTPEEEAAFEAAAIAFFVANNLIPLGATDNCDEDPEITEIGLIITGPEDLDCPEVALIECVFQAVDNCGNFSETQSTFIHILDETAPVLVAGQSVVVLECDELDGIPAPLFVDDCGEVEVSFIESEIVEEGCAYSFVRTYTAVDGCLNQTIFVQNITVGDTQGPVIYGVDPQISVQCIDEVPGPVDAWALDNCSGEEEVNIFTSETGDPSNTCDLTTAVGPGPDWAIWLPVLAADGQVTTNAFVFDANGGTFVQNNDGTAHLLGTVVNNTNANEQWILNLWFENAADWATWSALGRDYKDDLGCAQPDLFEDWTYYEMVNDLSTLTGAGDLAGSILFLEHMPSDYYYGFQIGQGANNKNCNYGLSGWFTYHGLVDCEEVSGHGDVNVNAECEDVFDEDCPNNTVLTHIYWSVDDNVNLTVVEQTVDVEDTTPPVFDNCPGDVFVQCPDEVLAVASDLTATDNCDDEVEIVYVGEEMEGDFPCYYTLIRTWFAEDDCDNRAYCIQHIHVLDNTAPIFTFVPENITIECSDEIPTGTAVAIDNCSNVTYGFSESSDGDECNAIIIRTYTATDECGNTATHTQVITIHDTTEPVFENHPSTLWVECDDLDSVEPLTATDNCDDDVVVTYVETYVSGGCLGGYYRAYTAVDDCGNIATANQFISLTDTTPPAIDCPGEVNAQCDDVPSVEDLDVTAIDNCGEEVTLTWTTAIVAGDCPQSYELIITYTAEDICENTSTCVTVVHVDDTTPPVFSFVPATANYECDEPIIFENAYAYDNCGSVTITYSDEDVAGDCPQAFLIIRTFYAEDECGNIATAAQLIYVDDTTAPEFTSGTDYILVECDEEIPYLEPTAVDNCDGVAITHTDVVEFESPCYTLIYRMFVAVDACGHESQYVQVIEIVDTKAPVVTGEIEIDLPCDNYEGIYITASDNCQGDSIFFDYNDVETSGGCTGRYIRTYYVSDYCGNSTTFEQIITLTDDAPPFASYDPQDFTIECGSFYDLLVPIFTDNCDEELELDFDVVESGDDCVHYITYTWSATDNCNNTTSVSQTVTIEDTTSPVWASDGFEITVDCNTDILVEEPTAYDLCNTVEISSSLATTPGECANEWTEVYTWIATDSCGNVSTPLYYTIHYVDNDAPIFSENNQVYFEVQCDDDLPYVEPSAYDLCGDVSLTYFDNVISDSDCFGLIYRIWTATDECGNFSSFYQSFNIYDDTAPVFNPFEIEIFLPCDNYQGIFVSATDNCDDEVDITYDDEPISGGCTGSYIRTYYAWDNCENVATVEQIITLTDNVPPVASFDPQDFSIECGTFYDLLVPIFTDNCDEEADLHFDVVEGGDACVHTYTYIWSATDNCNNTTSVSQTVTITDTEIPVFNIEGFEIDVPCGIVVDVITPTATDVCDEDVTVTPSFASVPGDCPNEHTEIYTFVATDDCGNSTTIQFIIHYVDEVAPYFTYVPAGDSFECDDALPTDEATADDTCGDAVVTSSTNIIAGECPNEYLIVITWTATDACGNTATETTTYSIYDNTPPTFDQDVDDVEVECADEVPAIPVVTASDNCGTASVTHDINYEFVDECGNAYYTVVYTATDECGNQSFLAYTVFVNDNTEPVLSDTPANLVLDCQDEAPAAPVVTATDNCDDDVVVEYNEQFYGDVPEPGSEGDCSLLTPAFPAVDSDCNYPVNWAMIMFNVPNAYKYYQLLEGEYIDNGDGTATITATLFNVNNPNGGFYVNVLLENGMDWPTFDSQPYYTNYKSDCVEVGVNYLDWLYYYMSNSSTLTGWGDYEGSFINLAHAPSNLAFAYQVGFGANNFNENYGSGGWFTHDGFIVDASTQSELEVNGAGDLAFEHNCCPDYTIVRTWCATDCSDNTTCWSQTISFDDLTPAAPGTEENPGVEKPVEGSFDIVSVNPNPTKDNAFISFTSTINNTLTMDVFDMAGRKIGQLFHGTVKAGETVNVNFETGNLEDGIYNIRLFSLNDMEVKRVIVER